jgi:hypothetical protein
MSEADQLTVVTGISEIRLMENVMLPVAQAVMER